MNNGLNVIFINLTFKNVFTAFNGGAIFNDHTNTKMTFIGCIFANNTAGNGGAIYNVGANFTVINSNFTNNNATSSGGAIYNVGANFTVISSNFTNNNAIFFSSGAIESSQSNLTVINSVFINNSAGSNGGAILTVNSNNSIITNSTFIGNYARFIGAAVGTSNDNNNLTIANSTFINNNAGNYGGTIYWKAGNNFAVVNSTFINNNAPRGGAILLNYGNNFTVANSNFTNNNASIYGGAIAISSNIVPSNNLNVINSNFTNNKASYGGAIYNTALGDKFTIFNSNFIGNIASVYGGGIYNNGNMLVSGNTMIGNLADILGNVIYNNGTMGILNLTYLNNSTKKVRNNTQVTLNATLTDDMGNPITGRNINFYVNNTLIGTLTSIEGFVSINYTPTMLGIVSINGKYSGNGLNTINIKQGQLEVVLKFSTNSTIVVPNNSKVNKTINITGIVTDEFGNSIGNIPINIKVDGDTYTLTTDSNGRWSLSYTPTHIGNMNVTVSWEGNDIYLKFTNTTSFIVKKNHSKIPEPKINSKLIGAVSMKETGIPILPILVVLLTSFGLIARRKR